MIAKITSFLPSRNLCRFGGFLFLLACLPFAGARGQLLQPLNLEIPMSDGKALSAHLYLPSQQGSYPVVLIQTPYNKEFFKLGLPLGIGQDLSSSPYAFVVLDWRCFYGSLAACTPNPDRGQDGYDAVEWIAAQPWCNGKVATWGQSALGNIQFLTASKQPPHLVCAVPIVAAPYTHYQHYYPGGALRTEYLQTLKSLFGSSSFSLVVSNPFYNSIWTIAENLSMYPDKIQTPMLLIGGWFDHNTNDVVNMFDTLRAMSPVASQHRLLIGPWTHSGADNGALQQGDLIFPEAEGWSVSVAKEFLAYHLLGENNGWDASAPVQYFQMGDNIWLSAEQFPPPADEIFNYTLYLYENLEMGPVLPFADSAALTLIYDPANPSPTVGGKTLQPTLLQGPYDQSAVEARSDALVFSGPTLTEPLRVNGQVEVTLHVSSDRNDTDFAVRLTDVYPDGSSYLLGEAIQRMRFRNGYTTNDTSSMEPGEVYAITLRFDYLAHTFKPGHKVRLIVTSSNYPRYNRNMNTGAEMYPNGNVDTLVNPLVAHNKLLVQNIYDSHITLPVAIVSSSTEVQSVVQLEMYPNPASDELVLRNLPAAGMVQVCDAQGRLVLQTSVQAGNHTLPLNDLTSGVYFVRFFPEGGRTNKSHVGKFSVLR